MRNKLNIKVEEYIKKSTGEVIEVLETTKKIDRKGFMITYLSYVISLIDSVGNKKMQVVKYILENIDINSNTLLTTNRELALKTNISYRTVSDALKILEEANIIMRRTGAIMINPKLIHRGSKEKEKILLTRFQTFSDTDIANMDIDKEI